MRTYEEIQSSLDKAWRLFEPNRIRFLSEILTWLNHPEKSFKIIQIAGTNGKGSTGAMLREIILAHGFSVGHFSSPAVYNDREQIWINGHFVSKKNWQESFNILENVLVDHKLDVNNLSYFEVWTIVSLLIFRSLKIQFVIMEAGLGGRNDATHVISQSLVIAFTKIAFDHQNILGNTIEDITKNKSALITQGSFVVSSVQEPVVTTILKEVSKKRKAIWFSEQPAIKILHSNQVRLKLSINQTVYTLKLLGKYQVENVALVWQVMSVLEKKLNINFRNCAIEQGLNNAKMIGRLDVDQDNMIIRDGAHNISAVQALIDTLKTWHLTVKPILILGILSDKNYNEMIEILLPHFELIIAVEPNNSRALSSDELITVIKKKSDTIPVVKISSEKAMAFAKKNRSTEQYIVIAGSFYTLNLLGESND